MIIIKTTKHRKIKSLDRMRQENKRNWTNVLAFAAIASFANAEIKTDTYWAANHDFENATIGVKVVDGIVEGTSAALTQRI